MVQCSGKPREGGAKRSKDDDRPPSQFSITGKFIDLDLSDEFYTQVGASKPPAGAINPIILAQQGMSPVSGVQGAQEGDQSDGGHGLLSGNSSDNGEGGGGGGYHQHPWQPTSFEGYVAIPPCRWPS